MDQRMSISKRRSSSEDPSPLADSMSSDRALSAFSKNPVIFHALAKRNFALLFFGLCFKAYTTSKRDTSAKPPPSKPDRQSHTRTFCAVCFARSHFPAFRWHCAMFEYIVSRRIETYSTIEKSYFRAETWKLSPTSVLGFSSAAWATGSTGGGGGKGCPRARWAAFLFESVSPVCNPGNRLAKTCLSSPSRYSRA